MKWVRDASKKFPERPYYDMDELDFECEGQVTSFLQAKHGVANFPISTDDLTVLVEGEVADLDLGVDLSNEGENVEGLTDFLPDSKPRVRISDKLMLPSMYNRLRTTLTHELGHVKFHSFLWAFGQQPLLAITMQNHCPRCKRGTILNANKVDWMEWQAGYASGAYLMPITHLKHVVQGVLHSAKWEGPVSVASTLAGELVSQVTDAFQVSADAARVRLIKCEFLTEEALPEKLI